MGRQHGLDALLLHNLYAIATPLTWNAAGDDAEPCAALPAGDEPPGVGPDAGTGGGSDSVDPDDDGAPGGCGCSSSRDVSNVWLLLALVVGLRLRRRHR